MTIKRNWIKARITKRTIEAEDIIALELAPAEGGEFPPFSAGSHIDFEVAPGVIRQYSLCNAAENGRYVIAILRDPASRGGSSAIHEQVREGDLVHISEPRNHFPLHQTRGTSILIAGGIGITPLLCMAERLHMAGNAFQLHYCARSPERTAFHNYISSSPIANDTPFYFSAQGDAARLRPDDIFATFQPEDHIYICGPSGFIDWLEEKAKAHGLPPAHIHREYFAADAAGLSSQSDGDFAVTVASSGMIIPVVAGESVAGALEKAGIEVPISCDQGVCGTCITRLIEGTPDHRDRLGLTGNAEFTPCCSRALTPMLVLDL